MMKSSPERLPTRPDRRSRPELRLKSFSVQSLNMASKRWEPRELHLTSDNICFGKKDSDIQIDCIPLDEILQVHHTEDQRGRTGRERFADGARRLLGLSQTEGAAQSSTFLQQFSSRHLSAGSDDERALAHPKSPKFNVMYAASYKAKGDDVHGLMLSDPCLIRTIKDGFNSGRVYRIRTSSQEELKRMMHDIQNGADARWEEKLGHGLFWWQRHVKNIYDADAVQSLSALIIMGSFLLSILSSELDNILEPDRVQTVDATFERIELVIVVVFTVELAMNAFGNWFLPFIQSPWNIFDVFVVVVCWLAVGLRTVPKMALLRVLRVFRVLRLVRGLTSLRQIVHALVACLSPICNAVALFLMITCIYAIIATDLFKERSPEFFGSFSASAFTMFQCATGDSWASVVTRELSDHPGDHLKIPIALFFVSFALVVGLVLMNVVIACLLDNFIRFVAAENVDRAKIKIEEERALTSCPGPLDPLLSQMATFVSFEDLENQISALWVHIDADRNGCLTCMEMNEGFRLVDVPGGADIYFSTENFLAVTDGLLSPDGSISRENFRKVMIRELHLYMQRQLDHGIPGADDTSMAILCGIKLLLSRKKFKAASESHLGASAGLPGGLGCVSDGRMGSCPAVREGLVQAQMTALDERMSQVETKVTASSEKLDQVLNVLTNFHQKFNSRGTFRIQGDPAAPARGPEGSRSMTFHANNVV